MENVILPSHFTYCRDPFYVIHCQLLVQFLSCLLGIHANFPDHNVYPFLQAPDNKNTFNGFIPLGEFEETLIKILCP